MEFKHLNSSLSENDVKLFHIPNILYENRYCNQDDFSTLVCGGLNQNEETLNEVYDLRNVILLIRKHQLKLHFRYNLLPIKSKC